MEQYGSQPPNHCQLSKGFPNYRVQSDLKESKMEPKDFTTLLLQPVEGCPGVVEVRLNRPKKRNAMNSIMWREVGLCFNEV